jgi:hypothetical protein
MAENLPLYLKNQQPGRLSSWVPEVGKVTLKINGDEALSDESV